MKKRFEVVTTWEEISGKGVTIDFTGTITNVFIESYGLKVKLRFDYETPEA